MNDPGFLDDVMASKNEEAKALLRLTGVVEQSERDCEHEWHNFGQEVVCQNCGAKRGE